MRLCPRELWFAFLIVGRDAFLRILALKQLLLQLALEGERALEGDLPAGLDGAFDAADRLRRLVRRAEAARVLHHSLPPPFGRPDVVDDAEALRLLEVEQAAVDHQLDRLRLADDAREPLRAARAGKHAERDLGEA